MSALWIALGVPALLLLGVRVGHSFGYRDGFERGRNERRAAGR